MELSKSKLGFSKKAVFGLVMYLFIDLICIQIVELDVLEARVGYFGLLLVFLGSLYYEYKKSKGKFFTQTPFVFSGYSFIYVFVGAGFFLYSLDSWQIWVEEIREKVILQGLVLTNMAVHCLWSGFNIIKYEPQKKINKGLFKVRTVPIRYIYILLGVSFLSILVAIYTGAFGFVARDNESIENTSGFAQYLIMGREISYLAVIIFTYFYFDRIKFRKYIYLGIGIFFLLGLLYGSKSASVMYLFFFVGTLLFMGKKFKLKFIAFGFIAVFISYAIIEPFRYYYMYGGADKSEANSVSGLTGIFITAYSQQGARENDLGFLVRTINRLSYTIPLSRAIEYAERTNHEIPDDYKVGKIVYSPFYAFVPRFIWKSKPKLYFGRWFSETVMGWDEFVSVAVTPQGYLYLASGYGGLIMIFLLLGYIHRLLYHYLYVLKYAIPLYIFFYFKVGGLDDLIWAYLSGFMKFFVVYMALYIFIERRYMVRREVEE